VAVVLECVPKLALVWVVGPAYALVGIAASSVLPMLVTALIVVPHQVSRISGLTPLQYLRCFERAAILGIAVLGMGELVSHVWLPSSWPALIVDMGLTGTMALAGFVVFGLNGEERQRIWALWRPADLTVA